MDCPKCGKGMGTLANQFWCSKCGAYFCNSCAREKLICPKCGGKISVDKTAIIPISLMMVAIIVTAVALLVSSISYSPEYANIADLQPGDHVRIYGRINSSSPVVARVFWANESWHLQNYTSFDLSDLKNSSLSISINLSRCEYFNLDEEPSSGCTTYEYRIGDMVTVKGWVTIDDTGNMSMSATNMYPGKLSGGDGVLLIPIYMGGGMAFLAVALAGVQIYRRSLHRRYLEQNPVLVMPDQLPAMGPSEKIANWMENPLYWNNLRWSKPLKYIAILAGLPLFFAGIVLLFLGFGPIPASALLFPAVMLIVVGGIQSLVVSNTPVKVAFAWDGLHMQYARPKPPEGARTFIAWKDIRQIQPPIHRNMGAIMELRDGITMFRASTELQDAFLKAYKQYKATPDKNGPAIEKTGRPASVRTATFTASPSSPPVTETIRNRMPERMAVLGYIVIITGVFAVTAYIFYYRTSLLDFWTNLMIICMMFFIFGLMFVGMGFYALEEIMFSDSGLKLKFRRSRNEPPTIPWESISNVSPVGLGWFSIEHNSGLKIKLMFSDEAIAERIVKEIDRRYLRTHPGAHAGAPAGPVSERFENSLKKRLGHSIMAMAGIICAGLLILILSMYLFYAGVGSTLWIILPMVFTSAMLALPFVSISRQYPLWRVAPEWVCLDAAGIRAEYNSGAPPPGHAGTIGWDEIRRIESLPEAVTEVQLTWELRDTDTRKTVVIRKKSGTAHILGPVDAAIAEAVRRRIPKTE